jgi:hypothetical protein
MNEPSNRDKRYQIDRIIQLEAENQRLKADLDLSHDNWDKLEKENHRLRGRIAELEAELETEKEFGMHYHKEFMKLFEKELSDG